MLFQYLAEVDTLTTDPTPTDVSGLASSEDLNPMVPATFSSTTNSQSRLTVSDALHRADALFCGLGGPWTTGMEAEDSLSLVANLASDCPERSLGTTPNPYQPFPSNFLPSVSRPP